MCSNGGYTERGIKQADGFMAERWRIEPDYAVRVDKNLGYLGVLLEPATVVAKAWEHIGAIGRRTFWDPGTVLVVGAGPIGLLAALIGVQLAPTFMFLTGLPPARNQPWSSNWAPRTIPELSRAWDCARTSWSSAPVWLSWSGRPWRRSHRAASSASPASAPRLRLTAYRPPR